MVSAREPKIDKNQLKNDAKRYFNSVFISIVFFEGFIMDFGVIF